MLLTSHPLSYKYRSALNDRMRQKDTSICDSIRINIALLLRGVLTREQMLANNIAGQVVLAHANRHQEHRGMTACYLIHTQGRLGVNIDMQKKIRDHVMNPDNDFTKVLPQGKTKVVDARALTVSKAEVYHNFPYKAEISLDKFSKLICGSKHGATPNLRTWLHETDICKICPQRKVAAEDLKTWAGKAAVKLKDPEIVVEMEDFIAKTAATPTYDTSLKTLAAYDKLVCSISDTTRVPLSLIYKKMCTTSTLGLHTYQKRGCG